MSRIVAVALFALLLIGSQHALLAQDDADASELVVSVVTEDAQDIPGGEVCVSMGSTPVCKEIPVNSEPGVEILFTDLAPGNYEVTGETEGYAPASTSVDVTGPVTQLTLTFELGSAEPELPTELPETGSGPVPPAYTSLSLLIALMTGSLLLAAAATQTFVRERR